MFQENLLKSIYDIDFLTLAVEMCLACCAECFVGIIESLVAYFNRYACFAQLSFVANVFAGTRTSKSYCMGNHIYDLQKIPGGCSKIVVSAVINILYVAMDKR